MIKIKKESIFNNLKELLKALVSGLILATIAYFIFTYKKEIVIPRENLMYHKEVADGFYNEGLFEKASEKYLEILKESNQSQYPYETIEILTSLGKCHLELAKFGKQEKRTKEALIYFTRANDIIISEKNWVRQGDIINLKALCHIKLSYVRLSKSNAEKALYLLNQVSDNSDLYPALTNIENKIYLGNAYLQFAEFTERKTNSQKALSILTKTLDSFRLKITPPNLAKTNFLIGGSYAMIARDTNRLFNSKEAIYYYHRALDYYTIEKNPYEYSKAFSNIGFVYFFKSQLTEKSKNLELSERSYKKALTVTSEKIYSESYARTHLMLSNVYRSKFEFNRDSVEIKKAINSANQALKIYSISEFPIHYSKVKMNLGAAYYRLAGIKDKTHNLKRSIVAMKEGLEVSTRDSYPIVYADGFQNLGMAYRELSKYENSEENLIQSLDCYAKALEFRNKEEALIPYVETRMNQANALKAFGMTIRDSSYLLRAVQIFKENLNSLDDRENEIYSAYNSSNLGETYTELLLITKNTKYTSLALKSQNNALKIFNKKDYKKFNEIVQNQIDRIDSIHKNINTNLKSKERIE